MADVTRRLQPPASMPLWPWLVAPALTLLLIVGLSAGCLLLANRGARAPQPEPQPVVAIDPAPVRPASDERKEPLPSVQREVPAPERPATPTVERVDSVAPLFPTRRPQ